MAKQKMSFRDAMDCVPDDLPDGAFWALAHEMAGLDYGDGFDELLEDADEGDEVIIGNVVVRHSGEGPKPWQCPCGRRFGSVEAAGQHLHAKNFHLTRTPED